MQIAGGQCDVGEDFCDFLRRQAGSSGSRHDVLEGWQGDMVHRHPTDAIVTSGIAYPYEQRIEDVPEAVRRSGEIGCDPGRRIDGNATLTTNSSSSCVAFYISEPSPNAMLSPSTTVVPRAAFKSPSSSLHHLVVHVHRKPEAHDHLAGDRLDGLLPFLQRQICKRPIDGPEGLDGFKTDHIKLHIGHRIDRHPLQDEAFLLVSIDDRRKLLVPI